MPRDYVIWSNELRSWLRNDYQTGTVDLSSAGRFTIAQALGVCDCDPVNVNHGALPRFTPIHIDCAKQLIQTSWFPYQGAYGERT